MTGLTTLELRAVSDYVYSICSLALDSSKGSLIEGRLASLAEECGAKSYGHLVMKARADAAGTINRRIIDAITTGETSFFRDTAPFDALRHKILPERIDTRSRAKSSAPIRIWSAACSTGQEAYSIAIVLKELLGDPSSYNFQILGTDISEHAVRRASTGLYTDNEIDRGLAPNLRDRYFTRQGDGWQVHPGIRALASFRMANLARDFSNLGRFDVILCRNVAMYFNESDRADLFRRLTRAMEPGGCLFIGALESLSGIDLPLATERHIRSIVYRFKG